MFDDSRTKSDWQNCWHLLVLGRLIFYFCLGPVLYNQYNLHQQSFLMQKCSLCRQLRKFKHSRLKSVVLNRKYFKAYSPLRFWRERFDPCSAVSPANSGQLTEQFNQWAPYSVASRKWEMRHVRWQGCKMLRMTVWWCIYDREWLCDLEWISIWLFVILRIWDDWWKWFVSDM